MNDLGEWQPPTEPTRVYATYELEILRRFPADSPPTRLERKFAVELRKAITDRLGYGWRQKADREGVEQLEIEELERFCEDYPTDPPGWVGMSADTC